MKTDKIILIIAVVVALGLLYMTSRDQERRQAPERPSVVNSSIVPQSIPIYSDNEGKGA